MKIEGNNRKSNLGHQEALARLLRPASPTPSSTGSLKSSQRESEGFTKVVRYRDFLRNEINFYRTTIWRKCGGDFSVFGNNFRHSVTILAKHTASALHLLLCSHCCLELIWHPFRQFRVEHGNVWLLPVHSKNPGLFPNIWHGMTEMS